VPSRFREQQALPSPDQDEGVEAEPSDTIGEYGDHPDAVGGALTRRDAMSLQELEEEVPKGGFKDGIRVDLTAFSVKIAAIIKKLAARRQKLFDESVFIKDRIKQIDTRLKVLRAQIAKIDREARTIKRKLRKTDKTSYDSKLKGLEKRLKLLEASKVWAKTLHEKVNVLDTSSPGKVVYETTLAEIKQSLAENVDEAAHLSGTDVLAELEDLESVSGDSVEDLSLSSSRKLYETTRLHHLTQKMLVTLDKKIKKTKEDIRKLREKHVPKHIAEGVRKAKAEIARLIKERKEQNQKLKALKYDDRLKVLDAELKKLHKLLRQSEIKAH